MRTAQVRLIHEARPLISVVSFILIIGIGNVDFGHLRRVSARRQQRITCRRSRILRLAIIGGVGDIDSKVPLAGAG